MKQDRELHSVQGINLRPIVSYPDVAQAGMSYLLSIDLELADLAAPWPYPQEEYEITFALDLHPYFSYQPVSKHEPAIILHRFGGTYGPAEYLITATEKAIDKGNINITFINGSGIPIASLDLPCEVRPEVPAAGERDMTVWGSMPVPIVDREPALAFAEGAWSGVTSGKDDEKTSRELIVEQLGHAGWHVTSYTYLPGSMDLTELVSDSALGIAIRGYPAFEEDYLLIVDGEKGNELAGIVKVHPIGETLAGTEDAAALSQRWLQLASKTKRARRHMSFSYESNGYETQFTNYLEPDARSRTLFIFHRPETLAGWLEQAPANVPVSENDLLRSRLRRMPPLQREGLRDYQFEAIKAIEQSLAENHSHTLIRMETGTGKTHTAMHTIYRLLKYGGARRILYLIDFSMAQDYAMGAFLNFTPNDEDHTFTDLYKVSRISSQLDPEAVVYVGTIADAYIAYAGGFQNSIIRLDAVQETLYTGNIVVPYSPYIPIEYFDVILLAESEHLDYQRWQPFLEYFDAFFIGIAEKLPDAMLNFFKQNLVNISNFKEDFTRSERGPGTTILIYDGHTKAVNSVAWSPDGQRIASGSADGTVHIWDCETGYNVLTYRSGSNLLSRIWNVKWSPDGHLIASCGLGVTVHVWDASTGADLVLYNHQMLTSFMTDTYALSWSPDGASIASATAGLKEIDPAIHVWDAATGRTQLKYAGHASGLLALFNVSAIAWSPDGRYIASTGTDKTVKRRTLDPLKLFHTAQIWDASTGQLVVTCHGSSNYIQDVSWSPDARFIATAEDDAAVHIWDAQSGEKVLTYQGHTGAVRAVAWSPDGSLIASASDDHTVQLWHATTGKLLYVYRGHTDKVATLAWSPDGTRIASGASDGKVLVWYAG